MSSYNTFVTDIKIRKSFKELDKRKIGFIKASGRNESKFFTRLYSCPSLKSL